jgi:hypothetical protein
LIVTSTDSILGDWWGNVYPPFLVGRFWFLVGETFGASGILVFGRLEGSWLIRLGVLGWIGAGRRLWHVIPISGYGGGGGVERSVVR